MGRLGQLRLRQGQADIARELLTAALAGIGTPGPLDGEIYATLVADLASATGDVTNAAGSDTVVG